MKRVHTAHRVRAADGDDIADPLGGIGRHQPNPLAAVVAEVVEERRHGLLVAARAGPHQPPRVVIDHDRQVALALAVRDLIDADPHQPRQRIHAGAALGDHPRDDPPHRDPGDTQQLGDRPLRRVRRQPRRLVLEVAGEPGTVPRPRHRRHGHPMFATGHPRRVGLQLHPDRAQVQPAPAAPALAVVIARRRPLTAPTATLLGPPRPHVHHHGLVVVGEPDVLNDRAVIDTDQPFPYPGRTHAASSAHESDLRTAGTVGQRRRCAMQARSTHPRNVHKSRI